VRIAFGATRGGITSLVLKQGLRLSAAGIVLGSIGAFVLTPFMESLLVGVTPADPWTFASIAAIMFAISVVATYLPVRRAASVDPVIALRE
jgi:putative ABC transport system permease protein